MAAQSPKQTFDPLDSLTEEEIKALYEEFEKSIKKIK